jgi:hypothetical protein
MVSKCWALTMTVFLLTLPVGPADAQRLCPEGQQLNGNCVNAGLAASNRKTAVIFSQPKISQTTLPVLPADDLRYRYPNQLIPDRFKMSPAFTFSP